MNTWAPTLVARFLKLAFPVGSLAQLYVSEVEPPGQRRVVMPACCTRGMVCGLPRLESQVAVLTPNHRASAVRRVAAASTPRWTVAGAGAALNWMSVR